MCLEVQLVQEVCGVNRKKSSGDVRREFFIGERTTENSECRLTQRPVPVAARSKEWVCSRSLAEILGLNPVRDVDVLSFFIVVCCQIEVSATGRLLI
jgi:hypothetical protein